MYFGNGTSTGAGTIYVTFAQVPQPTCTACGAPPTLRDQTGALWCKPCLDAHIRRNVIANASQWLTAAFSAVAVEQRAKLYKALNDVRDRMR